MSTAGAPPEGSPAGWDWPYQVTLPETQQVMDAHVVRVLEQSPRSFQMAWQTRQLWRLLQFTYERSARWRQRLPAKADIQAGDLSALPILSRAGFRDGVEAEGALVVPPRHGKITEASTSGSTGMPVRFFRTEYSQRLVRNHYWADHARVGRNLRELWASFGPHVPAHPGEPQRRIAGHGWLGESDGVARNPGDSTLAESAAWLADIGPVYLFTNPTLLSALLDAYESDVTPPKGLRQVATFGATVEPALRERARRVLDARICDRYSCEEAGPLAWQCPHDDERYHVCVSNVIIEVVDDDGAPCAAGEPGRVLVTALHHWASPVIRYDIGDVAALHPYCSCGARVPSLSNLLGRKRSLIRTATGASRFVRMTALDWLKIAPVREHRIIQQNLSTLRVELVLEEPMSSGQYEAIRTLLRDKIDPELHYEIVQLTAIDWPAGRKKQDVVGLTDLT
ncbi:phenylacetate--CoA ligase family protein [Variovorax sp. VNK109]|jgi:phenylacetate-CoA ligase|uniref:phenylacetate--CoA ligase family protein n=1 Tax=Variovorax sp. VNK109 TaxID=3400919 RepID=UPI003C04E004